MSKHIGLRTIAIFEAAKGLLALFIAISIHTLFSENARQVAIDLVKHCHLNPASYYPQLFINNIGSLTASNVFFITLLIVLYSIIRFIEAIGLWYAMRWTEWFALISGMIYIPFEIYEIIKQVSVLSVGALVINLAIVAYMAFILKKSKQQRLSQPSTLLI